MLSLKRKSLSDLPIGKRATRGPWTRTAYETVLGEETWRDWESASRRSRNAGSGGAARQWQRRRVAFPGSSVSREKFRRSVVFVHFNGWAYNKCGDIGPYIVSPTVEAHGPAAQRAQETKSIWGIPPS